MQFKYVLEDSSRSKINFLNFLNNQSFLKLIDQISGRCVHVYIDRGKSNSNLKRHKNIKYDPITSVFLQINEEKHIEASFAREILFLALDVNASTCLNK